MSPPDATESEMSRDIELYWALKAAADLAHEAMRPQIADSLDGHVFNMERENPRLRDSGPN